MTYGARMTDLRTPLSSRARSECRQSRDTVSPTSSGERDWAAAAAAEEPQIHFGCCNQGLIQGGERVEKVSHPAPGAGLGTFIVSCLEMWQNSQ